jgi:uncharacterized lipoprotein NlpE involved in copper resistance
MKRIGSIAMISLLALVGCDNASRLDKTTKVAPKADTPQAEAAPVVSDHSGTLEERVARLESNFARYGEALEFLNKVYAQQKQQQQAQEREEPAPDAMFAVDIAPDVKAGQVEGSPQALVTIVEAWDFA